MCSTLGCTRPPGTSCSTVRRAGPSTGSCRRRAGGQVRTPRCAQTTELEVDAWARSTTGGEATACGHCLRGGGAKRGAGTRPSGGGRTPKALAGPIEMNGDPIEIVVPRAHGPKGPPLRIVGAQWLAETFFRRDPSAADANSYDAWIAHVQDDPTLMNRITRDDLRAVNSTMAARNSPRYWPSLDADVLPELVAIDPAWDLFASPESEVSWDEMAPALTALFAAVRHHGIGFAVATKVLHIKRPKAIPVMDSVVVDQVGIRLDDTVASWTAALREMRAVGQRNLVELQAIQAHLAARGIRERTLVRILDALLWVSSPGAGLFKDLDGWERVFRPRRNAP
ncbi:MAG: DUF6308 family protein [Chloroflexota bacterium]